ncbi:MAG: hypothetical protein ACRDQU_15705 [Pseudonocardiaceae bacterium]
MQARIKNPAVILHGAMAPIQELIKQTKQGGVPERTLELVHLRAKQVAGAWG